MREFLTMSLDDADIDNNPQQGDAMTVDVLNEINQKFVPKDVRDIAIINTPMIDCFAPMKSDEDCWQGTQVN